MKKVNRRELIKLGVMSVGAALVVDKLAPLSAYATGCDDSKITQQGYVSDVSVIDSSHKEFKKLGTHQAALEKAASAAKKTAKVPNCGNCKQYKEKTKGCGTCPMVGATGQPGKLVKESGWCRVYMADASKLK